MNGTLHTVNGRSMLRFERRLAHPVEKVWRAITEPAHITHWFPADMEMELKVGGRIRFVFREGEGPPTDGTIVELDPPRVFAYTWEEDRLRWELQPEGDGCRLVFSHTLDDRAGAASVASGWQICLDALAMVLAGRPVELPDRHAELHEEYVDRFGLGEGSVWKDGDRWEVRFERQLMQPIDTVWATLTGSAEPEAGEPEPTVGGPAPLGSTNGYVPAGPVTAVAPPALIEYGWQVEGGGGRVRWELSQGLGGARVVLTQTIPAALAEQRATALAAWHTHLEVLASHLRGRTVCPWPAERTEELRQHYAAVIG